jgi:heme exporter protein B
MSAFVDLVRRDLRLATRLGGSAMTGVLFFLTVVTVIPFGVGPDMALLARIGPAILWIGALLATLLSLDRLFQADRDDGSLDLILAGPLPLELVVVAKCAAHWLATGLPLVVAVPALALFVNLEPEAIAACVATLMVGTPALTVLGAIGAALTVTLRRGGILMAILVLPFAVPVLIFGVAATTAAVTDPAPFLPPFLVLSGIGLIALVVGPVAAAAALRIAAE